MQYPKNKSESKFIMFEVESSNIKAIGYDSKKWILRIQFKAGEMNYDFKGVNPEKFQQFMEAESKGHFFFSKIKGKYQFEKK